MDDDVPSTGDIAETAKAVGGWKEVHLRYTRDALVILLVGWLGWQGLEKWGEAIAVESVANERSKEAAAAINNLADERASLANVIGQAVQSDDRQTAAIATMADKHVEALSELTRMIEVKTELDKLLIDKLASGCDPVYFWSP